MAAQIIIVDDDPLVGGLTLELLTDAGYSARLIQDSLKAQDIIKAEKPALVILDILMPGLDGLTLLHRLKSDPETEPIRAIIVSGKSFEAEKQRAAQYGAEAFIEKPYDVEQFAQKVNELMDKQGIEPKKTARAPSAPAPIMRVELKAAVWGCRSRTWSARETSACSRRRGTSTRPAAPSSSATPSGGSARRSSGPCRIRAPVSACRTRSAGRFVP
jgi:CheY-like chemotaxis protein